MAEVSWAKHWVVCAASAVPQSPEHKQLEPASRKQEAARRPDVHQHPDDGGARAQHHLLHTGFLLQPVSLKLLHKMFQPTYPEIFPNSRLELGNSSLQPNSFAAKTIWLQRFQFSTGIFAA